MGRIRNSHKIMKTPKLGVARRTSLCKEGTAITNVGEMGHEIEGRVDMSQMLKKSKDSQDQGWTCA